jgi:hypothetical protein
MLALSTETPGRSTNGLEEIDWPSSESLGEMPSRELPKPASSESARRAASSRPVSTFQIRMPSLKREKRHRGWRKPRHLKACDRLHASERRGQHQRANVRRSSQTLEPCPTTAPRTLGCTHPWTMGARGTASVRERGGITRRSSGLSSPSRSLPRGSSLGKEAPTAPTRLYFQHLRPPATLGPIHQLPRLRRIEAQSKTRSAPPESPGAPRARGRTPRSRTALARKAAEEMNCWSGRTPILRWACPRLKEAARSGTTEQEHRQPPNMKGAQRRNRARRTPNAPNSVH